MNKIFEKLKAINWKSKKTIIAYAVIFAILVCGTGTGLAVNYFNNNSDTVKTDIKDKNASKPADDKKEDKKSDNKKDTDKKADSSKPTEKKEENKKQETSKTDDNKINSSTNKTPVNNNNSNSNNNTGNSSNNGNNSTPTPPTNNGGGNSGNNSTPTPQPPVHQHSWVPDVEYIKHEEVYHMEDKPVYGWQTKTICSEPTCRKDLTGWKQADVDQHGLDHLLKGENGGHHDENVQVIVRYEPTKVVDQEEWTETIDKGEKCSSCGAKK